MSDPPKPIAVTLSIEARRTYKARRKAYRKAQGLTGSDVLHFAWVERLNPTEAIVHVEKGWDFDLGRLGHECWHLVTGNTNRGHHPASHFCMAAKVPIRRRRSPCLGDELEQRLLDHARELRRQGMIIIQPEATQ